MAHKRMFSKDITGSDAFLDMPSSSQSLYFHLGMEADDDGFIGNPKKVMRVIGVGEDDFKILLAKRFVLDFPSGVVVVKHHRINNNWDKYNCKRTVYLEEFSKLRIKDNKAYTLDETQGVPLQSDSSLKTVFRIEENRIDKKAANADIVEVPDVQEGKTPRPPKDQDALKAAKYWHQRCQEEYGIEPSGGLTKTMAIIQRAAKTLKYGAIRKMMDDWFEDNDQEPADAIQITRCLSSYQVDKFKAAHL